MGIFLNWFSKSSKPEQPTHPALPPLNPLTPLEDFVIVVPRISETVEGTIYYITRKPSTMEHCAFHEEMVRKGDTVAMCSGVPIVAPCDGKIHFKHDRGYFGYGGPNAENWPSGPAQSDPQRALIEEATLFKIQPVRGGEMGSYIQSYLKVEQSLGRLEGSTERAVIKTYLKAYGGKEGLNERMDALKKQCWGDLNKVMMAYFRREKVILPGMHATPGSER